MRSVGLSLSGLACVVALIVIAPKPANSQPSVLPLVSSASGALEVGYYYRRYGYGYRRPYYGYGYGYRRPYYGYGYGYRRPYYRPYYGYGYRPYRYGYRRWWR